MLKAILKVPWVYLPWQRTRESWSFSWLCRVWMSAPCVGVTEWEMLGWQSWTWGMPMDVWQFSWGKSLFYIYIYVCYSNLMDDGENHDQSWDGMRFQGLRQRHQHRLRLKATLLGWLKGSKQHAICIYDYTSCMMFYTCTRHRAYLYTVYNINTGYIYIINHHHYTDTTIYQHKWHTPFMSYIF